MYDRARDVLQKHWWGIFPAVVILLPVAYGLVWTAASPLDLLDRNGFLVAFLGTRAGALVALTLLLTLVLIIGLEVLLRRDAESELVDIHPAAEPPANLVGSYQSGQRPDFFKKIEELISSSSDITLIAIGLYLIKQPYLLDKLLARAKDSGVRITVCMGNPYSPLVQERWIEEMQGIAPQFGIEGSRRTLQDLVNRIENDPIPDTFRVLLFENYPTFATLIFDNEIFVYPYGFQLIGNYSPIFHFRMSENSNDTKFFVDNAQRVIASAVPAELIVRSRNGAPLRATELTGLMVGIVPDDSSDLYTFGSDVVGYDIINLAVPRGADAFRKFASEVAGVSAFGFHLRITDSLYFASSTAEAHVRAMVRAIALDFCDFEIDVGVPTFDFRDGSQFVMRCHDPSGTLEAIHAELVSRMYRMAIGSDDGGGLSGVASPTSSSHRDELLKRHYGSRNILSTYDPHFCLLLKPSLDPSAKRRTQQSLSQAFRERVPNARLPVRRLAVMKLDGHSGRWAVVEQVPLKSRV